MPPKLWVFITKGSLAFVAMAVSHREAKEKIFDDGDFHANGVSYDGTLLSLARKLRAQGITIGGWEP